MYRDQHKNQLFRGVAGSLVIIFGLTTGAGAQTPISISLEQKPALRILIPTDFTIPETLGTIQTKFSDPSHKPFVIVVQDAHGIVDAQKNIQKIIHYLQASYGLNLIALEGGDGKVDPTLLQTFPDEFIKKKVMENYLRQGELTGSSMAAIFPASPSGNHPDEAEFFGIEDWALYEDNYFAYLAAMQKKEKILKQLQAVRENLDKDRLKIYSARFNEFHEKLAFFQSETRYLTDFVEALRTFEETNVRLAKYPDLEKLFRSFEFEKESAKDRAGLESSLHQMAEAFKAKYLRRMETGQEMEFHKNHQAFVTGQIQPADFLQYLVETGKALGLKPKLTPAMLKLLGHSQTLAAIKGTKLFDELESLVREIENALIQKPEERELAEKYRQLNRLKNLVSLELTRHQWEEVKSIVQSRQSIEKPPGTLWTMDRGLWTDFQPALEFYRLALERDQAFRRNLNQLLKTQKSQTALVLAGGFHSQGFEQSLKEEGYSYVVITPKIQSLEGQETYAGMMQGKNISYKPYLKTTFYDAFMKEASMKLARELDEPAFRKNIRMWRENVIRRLAREGRTEETGDYTRYIDLVWKVYYDKFGNENSGRDARREILKAIDRELKHFRDDFIKNLRPQVEVPQVLQTLAGTHLMRKGSQPSPELVGTLLNGWNDLPFALVRSEVRASTDIRTTVNALITAVSQNSRAGQVLKQKFTKFSEELLRGQDAASRQTRVNFVNFYNTLLSSLRRDNVSRRQFLDILNQIFSFSPGHPSGNLDRILTGTQTVQQNGQKTYTIDTFYNALARTLIDYGLQEAVNWQNPYQKGLNERGRPRNQFGRLDRYFQNGLPAREVLKILVEVKNTPRETRIQAFEERLNALASQFARKTQVLKRAATQLRIPNPAPTLINTGAKTMSPILRETTKPVPRPAQRTRTSDLPMPLPRSMQEEGESALSDALLDEESVIGDTQQDIENFRQNERIKARKALEAGIQWAEEQRKAAEKEAFLAEVEAASKRLSQPPAKPAQAKRKVRSEVRAGVGEQIADAIWSALIEQRSQMYPEYHETNRTRFMELLKRKSVPVTGANSPRTLENITRDISKVVVRRIAVSDEAEQKTLGINAVYIAFDEDGDPRAASIYRPRIQQPVLLFRLAKSEAKPAPAVKAPGTVTLTDWILDRLEKFDERVEIYRHGYYQIEGITDLLEIDLDTPLRNQITELFSHIAQPAAGEIVSVLSFEPGIARENLEAALVRLSQNTADYESNQFAVRGSVISLENLGSVQSQKNAEQGEDQRILNNLFNSLPAAELAQEVDSQLFLRRLALSVGPPDTQPISVFSPKSMDHAPNDVFVNALAVRNILDNLPSGKAKGKMQEHILRLFTTPVDQLHKLDFKGSTWGEEGILDFRLLGAKGFRGYYLAFGNHIVVFAVLPASWTHSEAGKEDVLRLAKAENAKREVRRKEKKALFTAEEREASLQFFANDLKINVASRQAEDVAAAQKAEFQRVVEAAGKRLSQPSAKRAQAKRKVRSEVREGEKTEPVSSEHTLGTPGEEGWLLSDDEERLFQFVETSRRIRDIHQKLEQGKTVTLDDLKLVFDWLKLGNPLAMILGERLQGGDWVVNWQVSGVGEGGNEGGLGIKQFNMSELLGEQGYNDFKFKTLVQIIGEETERFFTSQFGEIPKAQKDQQYTRPLYDDFKGDIRIVKPHASEKLERIAHEDFKELLKGIELRIKQRATEELRKLLLDKAEALSKYGIDLDTAVNLIAIKVGFAQVKKFDPKAQAQLKAQARLEAVIHSTFARELPDGTYNQENYNKFVRDTSDLRHFLDQKGILENIFTDYRLEYTDSQGKKQKYTERVIHEDFAIYLRKKTAWEKLPDEMKEAFKNEELYKQAQAFFNRLSVQDYFIRWSLEFDKAAAEAHKILKVIQYLYQNLKGGVGITTHNSPFVQEMIQKYILKDARNRGVTSPVDFHSRAPPMEGTPTYVFMDVIGLGAELGKVLTAQLGLIDRLIQEGKWDEVGAIQRSSGAPIIDKKLKMQKAIQDTYERVLGEETKNRPLLMHVGGDEVALVFNTEGLSPDLLNNLWFGIRRAVNNVGFQIRIGIEADASRYREGYKEGIKNAANFAHMKALTTSDPLTNILKGLEEQKVEKLDPDFKDVLAIHQNGGFIIRVRTKEGIRDYTPSEVNAILVASQGLTDFDAEPAAALEASAQLTDEEIRAVADPLSSRLTNAVLNAGIGGGEDKLANWFLAQELLQIAKGKPLGQTAAEIQTDNNRTHRLAELIYHVLSKRDEKRYQRQLTIALAKIVGASPSGEKFTKFQQLISAAIDMTFNVRSLFSAEEVEEGRKKYGEDAKDLRDFLAKGWQRNSDLMKKSQEEIWYLANSLMSLRLQPQVKIASQAVSPAVRGARSELRRIIRGSKEMMERLSRGKSVEGIVQTVFASEFYDEAGQFVGRGESPKTVVLVDTIRGTVVWKLAELAGGVAPGEAAFEPSAGYKSITPQALFLLDHPDLLQKILAKSNPSADIWGRGLRVYDGALIAPIEDIARHKEDKEHIQRQLEWTTVVIAFQVGTEKRISDILRIPGVIPLAVKNDTTDLSKIGGNFEDVRMTLAVTTQIIDYGLIRKESVGIVYYNHLAVYLRESNLSLSRLARLSDLALSIEEVKSKMIVQDGAYVMTPEAFNLLVDYVERLTLDQEVQTAYKTAA